jgi:hypothetical protein
VRERRRPRLSTGDQWRKRRDTRGHEVRPVRDREGLGFKSRAPNFRTPTRCSRQSTVTTAESL